jgi:SNF2 family DNA or RNA helicase
VLFAQSASGGVGLNLQQATYVIFVEALWTPAAERQCIDRAHRRGQQHVVRAFNVYLRDSLDQFVLDKTHAKKRQIAHLALRADQVRFAPSGPE